jgi:hypothetical protein
MKIDYSKWIGYILFVVTLIGWGYSAGKFDSRMSTLENDQKSINTKVEKQEDLLLKQQEFNGKVITYIEMSHGMTKSQRLSQKLMIEQDSIKPEKIDNQNFRLDSINKKTLKLK